MVSFTSQAGQVAGARSFLITLRRMMILDNAELDAWFAQQSWNATMSIKNPSKDDVDVMMELVTQMGVGWFIEQ